jgi:hypothetical protein
MGTRIHLTSLASFLVPLKSEMFHWLPVEKKGLQYLEFDWLYTNAFLDRSHDLEQVCNLDFCQKSKIDGVIISQR